MPPAAAGSPAASVGASALPSGAETELAAVRLPIDAAGEGAADKPGDTTAAAGGDASPIASSITAIGSGSQSFQLPLSATAADGGAARRNTNSASVVLSCRPRADAGVDAPLLVTTVEVDDGVATQLLPHPGEETPRPPSGNVSTVEWVTAASAEVADREEQLPSAP